MYLQEIIYCILLVWSFHPKLLLHSFNRKEIKQLLSELDEEKKIRLRLQVLKLFLMSGDVMAGLV